MLRHGSYGGLAWLRLPQAGREGMMLRHGMMLCHGKNVPADKMGCSGGNPASRRTNNWLCPI